ncbi:nucleotidyltransferase domain-containing protein [Vallitalea longa]|uniref:nucleotidyltransferase domain-containing protein n=1 Tax=Vallitalea longa TaxID=2936439 RepID=UPI00249001EF|nr:nucleotidyltransferase domain-containing protein [Vallitalea longa]
MDKLLIELKNYLVEKYNCHIIILYGSYARGDYTPESDIDIICFADDTHNCNDTEVFNGKQLDVWIYDTKCLNHPEDYLHILNNKILFDSKDMAKDFIGKIDKIYKNGPEKLDENKKQFHRDWLKKMYNRSKKGDIEGIYRHHWMMKDSLEIYFELKGKWFLGVKNSLKWMQENDKTGYDLFKEAIVSEPGSEKCRKIIEYITEIK